MHTIKQQKVDRLKCSEERKTLFVIYATNHLEDIITCTHTSSHIQVGYLFLKISDKMKTSFIYKLYCETNGLNKQSVKSFSTLIGKIL